LSVWCGCSALAAAAIKLQLLAAGQVKRSSSARLPAPCAAAVRACCACLPALRCQLAAVQPRQQSVKGCTWAPSRNAHTRYIVPHGAPGRACKSAAVPLPPPPVGSHTVFTKTASGLLELYSFLKMVLALLICLSCATQKGDSSSSSAGRRLPASL